MTWTKLSDDFPDQCARVGLTDQAFRTHVEGLCWAMRRENGGLIDQRDIRRFAEVDNPAAAVVELLEIGWWVEEGVQLRIVKHMEDQPEPDVIEARRTLAAERQRKKRRKDARLDVDVSRSDNTRDDPRDPGRVGAGRDGPGKPTTSPEGREEEWPDVAIPGTTNDLVRETDYPSPGDGLVRQPDYPIFDRIKDEANA